MPARPNSAYSGQRSLLWSDLAADPMPDNHADATRVDRLDSAQKGWNRVDLGASVHEMSGDQLAMAWDTNPEAFSGPAPGLNPLPALLRLLRRAGARLLTWQAGSTDTLPTQGWGVTGAHGHAGNNLPG